MAARRAPPPPSPVHSFLPPSLAPRPSPAPLPYDDRIHHANISSPKSNTTYRSLQRNINSLLTGKSQAEPRWTNSALTEIKTAGEALLTIGMGSLDIGAPRDFLLLVHSIVALAPNDGEEVNSTDDCGFPLGISFLLLPDMHRLVQTVLSHVTIVGLLGGEARRWMDARASGGADPNEYPGPHVGKLDLVVSARLPSAGSH